MRHREHVQCTQLLQISKAYRSRQYLVAGMVPPCPSMILSRGVPGLHNRQTRCLLRHASIVIWRCCPIMLGYRIVFVSCFVYTLVVLVMLGLVKGFTMVVMWVGMALC